MAATKVAPGGPVADPQATGVSAAAGEPTRTRATAGRTLASRLPGFPWDVLEPASRTARAHPGGIVDLSMGSPVDPVPELVRDALAAAANSPGYPLTKGTGQLRAAAADWLG